MPFEHEAFSLRSLARVTVGKDHFMKNRFVVLYEIVTHCAASAVLWRRWSEDISDAKNFDDLPENCKKYILRIEELVECKIQYIGTGPGREDVIERS